MKIFKTYSSEETKKIGEEISRKVLSSKPEKKALLISLMGNLGAGKTTFMQGFLKAAGYKGKITSPTFILMKRFGIKSPNFKNVFHADAYRLKDEDVGTLRLDRIINDPSNILMVEWAENIPKTMKGSKKIKFAYGPKENERKISIDEKLITNRR